MGTSNRDEVNLDLIILKFSMDEKRNKRRTGKQGKDRNKETREGPENNQ